jgi:SAM-dependent methyltransferase
MVAAAERACEDLHNVAFEAIGAEDPVDTPRPFNAVYSRLGIMFCADVGLALQRIAEVVQPEGTLCIAVWGPASQNQWSEVPSRILIEHQGLNPPGPDDPSAFHMADPDAVRAALREAGWRTYAQEPVLVPGWEDGGPEQTWERLRATAGPIGALFERTPEDERPALRQRILSALAEVPSGGLTGLAWVHAARRS